MPTRLSSWLPLRSAECARRTGLTARALRLYERHGLVQPTRDAHGWRLYRHQDLARLNAIAVLKFLGLSLGQIRASLAAGAPSLRDTLERQKAVWRAQQERAVEALGAVEGALTHLERRGNLQIEMLCALVGHFEMPGPEPAVRTLTARRMSPREIRVWSDWWADHPEDLTETTHYLAAQQDLLGRMRDQMTAGKAPADRGVGQLIANWERLLVTHHVRERAIRQLAWNRQLTTKWYRLGQREALDEVKPTTPPSGLYSPEFADFLEAAYWQSASGRALDAQLQAAHRLATTRIAAHSRQARLLAAAFRTVCDTWRLGDPVIHAHFAEFIESLKQKDPQSAGRRLSWRYLGRALAAQPIRTSREH